MASKFPPSSFIPKGGAQYSGPTASRKRHSSSLLLTTAIVIAAIAALAAGGVFFYTQYLESNLADKKQELAQAQAAFDPEIIDELEQLDMRINAAGNILNNHTVVTPVLSVVESITLESVQLISLTIMSPELMAEEQDEDEAGSPRVGVSLVGVARDYAGVALQSQVLSENEVVRDPILSNFTLNDQGDVEFSIEFFLDPDYMAYESTL